METANSCNSCPNFICAGFLSLFDLKALVSYFDLRCDASLLTFWDMHLPTMAVREHSQLIELSLLMRLEIGTGTPPKLLK